MIAVTLIKEVQKGATGSMSEDCAKVKVIKLQFEALIPPLHQHNSSSFWQLA